ncbi:hypothetical protein BpHYR1_022891 [Brachionus plicatilis]|uniref:Uncharacterized protein n=1 Tax=Brachionus plicatilis TaxID=10195 RepID=A0A3M7PDG1_BRAPC|nr:hypothetical protein BpHYR1_022891 [Brachionus plicatilis]
MHKIDFFEAKYRLIDIFREKSQLKLITITPSLVQHTGMHSSLIFKDLSYNGCTNEMNHFLSLMCQSLSSEGPKHVL